MNSFALSLLMAGSQASDGGASGGIMTFVPFIAIIAIFYFLIIRPQNKKQKETQKMLSSVKKGDRVTTIGGIRGSVTSVKEKFVVIKVDDNTKIEFTRSAIASIEESAKEDKDDEKKEIEESEKESEKK